MKIRSGFVSNSSSSSFVCGVCGVSYEGWDGQYEVKHYSCNRGHEVCGNCSKSITETILRLASDINNAIEVMELTDAEANEFMGAENKVQWIKETMSQCGGDIHEAICPLCNLIHISGDLEAQYLCEKFGITRDEVRKEMRAKYKNLKEWRERK